MLMYDEIVNLLEICFCYTIVTPVIRINYLISVIEWLIIEINGIYENVELL